MFRLEILSGKKAGFTCEARRFPFGVGRTVRHGLQIDDFGLHDHHMDLMLKKGRLWISSTSGTATLCNYQPVAGEAEIGNGDVVSAGALSFRVVLGDIDQKPFRTHAALPFVLVGLVSIVQLAIIIRLWD